MFLEGSGAEVDELADAAIDSRIASFLSDECGEIEEPRYIALVWTIEAAGTGLAAWWSQR